MGARSGSELPSLLLSSSHLFFQRYSPSYRHYPSHISPTPAHKQCRQYWEVTPIKKVHTVCRKCTMLMTNENTLDSHWIQSTSPGANHLSQKQPTSRLAVDHSHSPLPPSKDRTQHLWDCPGTILFSTFILYFTRWSPRSMQMSFSDRLSLPPSPSTLPGSSTSPTFFLSPPPPQTLSPSLYRWEGNFHKFDPNFSLAAERCLGAGKDECSTADLECNVVKWKSVMSKMSKLSKCKKMSTNVVTCRKML